jgi:hypothetical protein
LGIRYDGTYLISREDQAASADSSKQLWTILEAKLLFSPWGEDGSYSEEHHLAQTVSILGPPPLNFLERSTKSQRFWDDEGRETFNAHSESLADAPVRPMERYSAYTANRAARSGAIIQGRRAGTFVRFARENAAMET